MNLHMMQSYGQNQNNIECTVVLTQHLATMTDGKAKISLKSYALQGEMPTNNYGKFEYTHKDTVLPKNMLSRML